MNIHIVFVTIRYFLDFKQHEDSKEEYIENTINGKNRMLFTQYFIKKQFQNGRNYNLKIRKQSNINLDFSYCIYLFEVCGSRVQCIYELNKMIFEKKLSLREQMYAHHLIERIKESFMNKSNSLDLFVALNYEKILNNTFSSFQQSLQQKFKLFDLINSDQINLINLTQESDKLINLRNQYKNNVIELIRINQNHPAFLYLEQEYLNCFAFLESHSSLNKFSQNKKNKKVINESESNKKTIDQVSQNEENLKQFYNFKKEELFNDKSCVLFVRITGNQVGYVIQAQKNFSNLFGYTQIVGQSINTIIPSSISQYHNRHINNFVSQVDQLNQSFSGKFLPLQIALNKQGWAVPVNLRMQVEYLAEYNELGLSCVIQEYQTDNSFMLIDVESSKIQAISLGFYNQHLEQIFSIKELVQIRLCRIIPALLYFTDKQKFSDLQQLNYIQTFAFLPDKGVNSQIKLGFTKQLNLNKLAKEIEDYANKPYLNIYLLNFKLSFVNEAYQKLCILEIESFRQITSELEIKDAFQQAQMQFQSIFSIQIPNFIKKSSISLISEKLIDVSFSNQKVLSRENQSHNFDMIDDEIQKKLQINNNLSAQEIEQINISKLETDQNELKTIQQSSNVLFSIQSQRQNIMSNTTLLSPRRQLASINFTNQNKVKIESIENFCSSQEMIAEIKENATPQDINQNIVKIEFKVTEKVEEQANIWQFDQFNQCNQKLVKNRKIIEEGYDYLNSNGSSLERRIETFEKSTGRQKGKMSQNVKEGATASIKSSISHSSELKRTIHSKIKSTKKGVLMTFLNILTIISIIPLITMTLYLYLTMTSQFSLAKKDFQMIPWPMSMRAILSQNLQYVIFIKFIDSDIFPEINQQWSEYKSINQQKIQSEIQEFNYLYNQFLTSDQEELTYFKNVTDFKLNFVEMRDQVSQLNKQFNLTVSFQTFIYHLYTHANRLSTLIYNEYNEEGTVLSNFASISSFMSALAINIQQKTRQDLEGIYDQSILIMQIIIILSFVVISGILPANYLIKNQVEEILKLFATIPPQHLQEVLQRIKISAYKFNVYKTLFTIQSEKNSNKIKNQFEKLSSNLKNEKAKLTSQNNLKQLNFKLDPSSNFTSVNQKKKSISLTTTINKLQLKLIVYCLLAFIVLVIQPITNIILIKSFNDQALINIDLLKFLIEFLKIQLGTLYDLKAHFCSNLILNYWHLYNKLYPDNKMYNPNYYKIRAPAFFPLNVKKLANLNDVVGKQIMTDRYQMDSYNNFLFKILNGNMCDAFKNYPQYYNQTYLNFNYDTCKNTRNSIMTKGFQITSKYFLDQFPVLYDILSTKDQTLLIKKAYEWQDSFHLKEFDEFSYFLIQVITVMKDFLVNRNNDYMNYMMVIQTFLLVFQCLALSLVFYFGLYNFYKSITNDLNKSKSYLTLIDIDQIIENPYLMSYINKQK